MRNIVATIFIALFVTLTATQINGQVNGGGRLAGAWDANVKIYVCATGATIREFASLGTFNQGGTFTGLTSGLPPSARSIELGVWGHVQGNAYKLRFKAFQFDAAGNPTGYQIVTHDVELDEQNLNYVSNGGVVFYNMVGTPVATGCSSAVGTRMTLD